MAALVGFVFLLVPVAIAVFVLLLPAVVDLVMRVERVPLWWAIPYAILVPFTLTVLALPQWMDAGIERAALVAGMWAGLHLALAGLHLALAMGLALSRGLRPGGDTVRRRRTSLGAIVTLLGTLVVPWLPGLGWTAWCVPAAWAGIFWVIALNRRGPQRLERGKAVSASLLYAAAISFLIAVAHMIVGIELESPGETVGHWGAWLGSLVMMVLLLVGFRAVSGPPSPWPLLATIATGISLIFPWAWWRAFDPVPDDVQLPVWEDFSGASPAGLEGYRALRCAQVIPLRGPPRQTGGSCYGGGYYDVAMVDAERTLDSLEGLTQTEPFLVGDGRSHTASWGRYEDPLVVVEENGVAALYVLDTHIGSAPLGPALQVEIARHAATDRPLLVDATPKWTVQDFIRMCASLNGQPQCSVTKWR